MMYYHYWQGDRIAEWSAKGFTKSSPNLVQLKNWLLPRFPCFYWGIFAKRPIKRPGQPAGLPPSSHWPGAALDWTYGTTSGPTPRPNTAQGIALVQLLEQQYELLGIQMIIDLERYRIWKVDRLNVNQGWLVHPDITGGGEHRLHIETNDERWSDNVPIADRFPPTQEPEMQAISAENDSAVWHTYDTGDGPTAEWTDGTTLLAGLTVTGQPKVVGRAIFKRYTRRGPLPEYLPTDPTLPANRTLAAHFRNPQLGAAG